MSQPGLSVQEAGDAGKTLTGRGLGQMSGFVPGGSGRTEGQV